MAMSDHLRHRMIEQAVRRQPDTGLDFSMLLWKRLATELNPIIGARGFESLYARSLFKASATFAWIEPHPPTAADDTFRLLAASLKARHSGEAQAANAALLNIFTDTLIILVGELLTDSILRKAWGDDVVNNAGTEHRS